MEKAVKANRKNNERNFPKPDKISQEKLYYSGNI